MVECMSGCSEVGSMDTVVYMNVETFSTYGKYQRSF